MGMIVPEPTPAVDVGAATPELDCRATKLVSRPVDFRSAFGGAMFSDDLIHISIGTCCCCRSAIRLGVLLSGFMAFVKSREGEKIRDILGWEGIISCCSSILCP